jgi:hypothetical protein
MPPFLAAFSIRDYIIAGLAALCLLLTLNTYLDFHIGPVGWEGWKPKAERFERERDACHTASDQNAAAQKAQKAAYEAKYKEMAHEADEQVERAQADALAATDRYIAAHRVQRNQGGVSAPVATASDSGSVVPETVPAGIVMGEADVRACAALYPYAVEAHNWAVSLSQEGDQ